LCPFFYPFLSSHQIVGARPYQLTLFLDAVRREIGEGDLLVPRLNSLDAAESISIGDAVDDFSFWRLERELGVGGRGWPRR